MKQFIHYLSLAALLVSLLVQPVGVRAATEDSSGDGATGSTIDSGAKPPEFSAELISCLKSTIGEAAYQEITSGDREASDDEFDKGDTCFERFGPKIDPAQQPSVGELKFAPGTEKCLKEKLGENFQSEFASTKSKDQAKAFRSKTKDCFGKNVAGNGPGELPAEVRSCIVGAVGQAEADKMMKGNPPQPGSELFKKIEGAKCFKNFGPPPGHDRPEISAEAQACVEKIMGHSFEEIRTEPSEEQKQQIGKECFGGQGGPGGPQMPEAVQSCLNDAFGGSLEDLKKGPEFMTDEQKGKADDCFRKNNFNPGGDHGGPNGGPNGGPQMSDEARKCVEGIMGKLDGPKEPTEEQKQRMGKECFGGQGGPGGPNGGPGGGPQGGPGANLPDDKRACVEKIMGAGGGAPTEEQKQQIGKECFGGGGPGGPNGQQGPPPNGDQRPPEGGDGNKPFQQQGPPPGTNDNGANRLPGGPPPAGNQGPQTPPVGQDQNPALTACVDRITGGTPPTDEQRQQIDRECPK